MTDWRTTRGAVLTDAERIWIKDVTAAVCEGKEHPIVVHIGVDYGASLHCSKAGAPHAEVIGVDLDISKCIEPEQFTLLEGDSQRVARQWDGKIDFLFIDGDHSLEAVHADIAEWVGRVRSPGVVAFHDYRQTEEIQNKYPWVAGVKQAVDGWHWAATTWNGIKGADSIVAFGRKPPLRRGEPFGTIGFGVPYYKGIYQFWRSWTWEILMLGVGDHFLNTNAVPGDVPIPLAHNALVQEFLRSDRDTLCIIEDDHSWTQGIINRMREKRENWDFDIVCASYVSRREPLTAVGCNLSGSVTPYGEYDCIIKPMEIWREGTQPMDIACLGMVLIRRWVLEAMQGDKELDATFWFDWRGRNSQDVVFYAQAKELGARTGVDRDNPVVHWGRTPHTMDEYYKRMDEAIKTQEVANG